MRGYSYLKIIMENLAFWKIIKRVQCRVVVDSNRRIQSAFHKKKKQKFVPFFVELVGPTTKKIEDKKFSRRCPENYRISPKLINANVAFYFASWSVRLDVR